MGIASHLSWANFLTVQATLFPNLILFLFLSLQNSGVSGAVKIQLDGTTMSYSYDNDEAHTTGLIATAIITMNPGQKVSDSLLFYVA
jgi:hypothetical protein